MPQQEFDWPERHASSETSHVSQLATATRFGLGLLLTTQYGLNILEFNWIYCIYGRKLALCTVVKYNLKKKYIYMDINQNPPTGS